MSEKIKICKSCQFKGEASLFHGNTCKKCINIKKNLKYKKIPAVDTCSLCGTYKELVKNKLYCYDCKLISKQNFEKNKICKECKINSNKIKFHGKLCNRCSRDKCIKKKCLLSGNPMPPKRNDPNKTCKECNFIGDKSLFNGHYCKECNLKNRRVAPTQIRICGSCNLNKDIQYKKKICEECRIINIEKTNNHELKMAKEYYYKHREEILAKRLNDRINNKDNYREKRRIYIKNRRKNDIFYYLMDKVSSAIREALKCNGGSKNGESILKYLPYTIKELKKHLESKFESWMNWKNNGLYRIKYWNNEDNSTWFWQIDHIIPQSTLRYKSMKEENFKKCWALENLRPLSAKENLLKGAKIGEI